MVRRLRWFSGLAFCAIATGCVQVPETGRTTVWKDHFVVANKRGEAENRIFEGDDRCSEGTISQIEDSADREIYRQECQVNRVLANFSTQLKLARAQEQNLHPIIFIHGGLNEVDEGIERVHRDLALICRYSPDRPGRGVEREIELCEHDGSLYYPIFLNWHSGFWSSYWDQIYNVRGGQRIDHSDWKWLHRVSTPAYVAGDLLTIVATAPASWAYQGYRFFTKFSEGGSAEEARRSNEPCSAPCVLLGEPARPTPRDQVVDGVLFAVTSPAKLLTTPAVAVLGERAWLNMRRRTQAVFWTQEDFDLLDIEPAIDDGAELPAGGNGVFARFLREFQLMICEVEAGTCARHRPGVGAVVLVAHSMGAMIANRMVREYDLGYDHIVYMAAAATIKDSYDSVVSYLSRRAVQEAQRAPDPAGRDLAAVEPATGSPGPTFYNLMLYPGYDAWEDTTHVVPSGSLLEWIDSMYESADSDMDRMLGKWANTRRAVQLADEEAKPHIVFKVFGAGASDPRNHGQFDELPYWRPSCWGGSFVPDLPPGPCIHDQEAGGSSHVSEGRAEAPQARP